MFFTKAAAKARKAGAQEMTYLNYKFWMVMSNISDPTGNYMQKAPVILQHHKASVQTENVQSSP